MLDRLTRPGYREAMRLWRLHGPARVLSAGLYPHVDGTELRVYFEPEQAQEILERQIGDAKVLERRAAVLRHQLIEQGWVELANEQPETKPALGKRKTGVLAAASVASGLAFWWWRRRRRPEEKAP
jgi:hypothetical protein